MSKYTDMLAAYGVTEAHPGGWKFTKKILDLFPVKEKSQVLEVGCGLGDTAKKLATEYNTEVTALEKHPKMMKKARERHHQITSIQWIEEDILSAELPSNFYDSVFCESVLSFTNISDVLQKISASMKTGGKIYALEPVYAGGLSSELLESYKQFYGFTSLLSNAEWNETFTLNNLRKICILQGEGLSEQNEEDDIYPELVIDKHLKTEYIETLEKHLDFTNKYLAHFEYAYFIYEKTEESR